MSGAYEQELERDRKKKATSSWVSRYQEQAKCELVDVDIAPLMDRFESVSLYHKPQRKPLNVALQEMSTANAANRSSSSAANQSNLSSHPSVEQLPPHPGLQRQNTLKRQATKVIRKRRVADQQAVDNKNGATAAEGEATVNNARARVVPTRFLYDTTRWKQSSRCDYCSFAGGDLECATCDVIAHARCYLSAYESTPKKTKGAFVVPTRFSWLCAHCQQSLQQEYDERSKQTRMQHIALQRHIFGKVVTAYVRMTKDAMTFQAKKRAIVKIQAIFRGRLARLRFDRIQRMCLKPYAVDGIKVRGFGGDLGSSSGTGAGMSATIGSSSTEDLRLSNGFTCNPYVYVSVVDGKDDENQLFCFETSLRKGMGVSDAEVCWGDRLFVPGVDGNVTLCFTLLSKNGPNNFFLGQAVLRLRDSDVIWRSGVTTELPLSEEVEVFPKTTQHQLLRLVEISGGHSSNRQPKHGVRQRDQQHQANGLFANSTNSTGLTLSVHVKPFSDVHSYCGYMGMKNTLDSFQTSSRWCVLADGVLRIYRHLGVTLASDVVDMARALEVKLVETSRVTNNGVFHREQNCLAIQHVSRLYLLQCDNKATNKLWLKKLQAATKFGSALAVGGGDQSSCSASALPQNIHNSNTS